MDATTAKAFDEALSLVEDAVQFGQAANTKAAQLESQLVGEKVLLEKVASLEKRASATVTFDPALVNQAAAIIVQVGGGDLQAKLKIKSRSSKGDGSVRAMGGEIKRQDG